MLYFFHINDNGNVVLRDDNQNIVETHSSGDVKDWVYSIQDKYGASNIIVSRTFLDIVQQPA